jgi:DNA-binding CsgD family transcriptional regulator
LSGEFGRILAPKGDSRSGCARARSLRVLTDIASEIELSPLNRLSAREIQVLKLVVEGQTSKEIARVLGVLPTSVDTYRSRIMAKLGVSDVPSLVRLAIRTGLLKL